MKVFYLAIDRSDICSKSSPIPRESALYYYKVLGSPTFCCEGMSTKWDHGNDQWGECVGFGKTILYNISKEVTIKISVGDYEPSAYMIPIFYCPWRGEKIITEEVKRMKAKIREVVRPSTIEREEYTEAA